MKRGRETPPALKLLGLIIVCAGLFGLVVMIYRTLRPAGPDENESLVDASTPTTNSDESDRFLNAELKSKSFWIVDASELSVSPTGTHAWIASADQSQSLCWSIQTGQILEKYPAVLFYRNSSEQAIGRDPRQGDVVFSFSSDNSRASRQSFGAFPWTPTLGQSAGDDQAAIFANDQFSTVVYADGRRFESTHEPISTDVPTKWTSDLLHRYYFDDGVFHRYNELTQAHEVIYETKLDPAFKADFAPDAQRAIVANSRQVELVDLATGEQLATAELPIRRAIREVHIAQTGNSAAILLRERNTETELSGNVELFDLEGDQLKHHGTLPSFPFLIAFNREGTHLCVLNGKEAQPSCSYWDLGFSPRAGGPDLGSVAAFVDPEQAIATTESGQADPMPPTPDALERLPRLGTILSESPEFPFELARLEASDDLSVMVVQAEHYLAGDLATWNASKRSIMEIKTDRENLLGTLRISRDGSVLACGRDILDATTGSPASPFDAAQNDSDLSAFANDNLFSGDGKSVLGITFGNCVLWDRNQGSIQPRASFADDNAERFRYFDASSDLATAFACDEVGTIVRLDVMRGRTELIHEANTPIAFADVKVEAGQAALVEASGSIRIVQLDSGVAETIKPVEGWAFLSVRLARDGRRAIATLRRLGAGPSDHRLAVIDLASPTPDLLGIVEFSSGKLSASTATAISSNGSHVAIGTTDRRVHVYHIE